MTVHVEMFAWGPVKPEQLWALVGDPRRLTEWTDADHVQAAPEPPVEVGSTFTTVDGDRQLRWTVITIDQRLIEAQTTTSAGRIAVGAKVIRERSGSRLVLAGELEPAGSRLRARLVHLPGLRRRMDRWVRLAITRAGEP